MIKLKYLILPIVVVVFGVTTCYGYFEDFFDGAEYAAGYTDPYDHNEFVHIQGIYRWEKCYPGVSAIGEISDPVSYWGDFPHKFGTYNSPFPGSVYGFIIEYDTPPN